jgi:hypothetical protein
MAFSAIAADHQTATREVREYPEAVSLSAAQFFFWQRLKKCFRQAPFPLGSAWSTISLQNREEAYKRASPFGYHNFLTRNCGIQQTRQVSFSLMHINGSHGLLLSVESALHD